MPAQSAALMRSLLGLLGSAVRELVAQLDAGKADSTTCLLRLRQWLLVNVVYAFGAPYGAPYRRALAIAIAAAPEASALPLPPTETGSSGNSLFDYHFNISTGTWSLWSNEVPKLDLQPSAILDTSLIIPTVDTVRNTHMLEAWMASRAPLLLCGPPGSGKTMLVNAVLTSTTGMWAGRTHAAWLSFSSATSPEYVLRTIEQYCEYVKTSDGWTLQPLPLHADDDDEGLERSTSTDSSDSWLMVFCDEINLPAQDKYGTQRVISLLRDLTEQDGFWAPLRLDGGSASGSGAGGGGTTSSVGGQKGKNKSQGPSGAEKVWVSLRRVQFVGACNPPTDAGRVPLPPRFLRYAPVLYLDYPVPNVMLSIYASLTAALCKLHPSLAACGQPLAAACLEAYVSNASRFKAHMAPQYVYSPRELSRWMRALYEGIAPLAADKSACGNITPVLLARLWLHEGLRLFHDRLVTPADQAWCADELDRIAKKHFGGSGSSAIVKDMDAVLARPILFSDWTQRHYLPSDAAELRRYMASRAAAFCEETGEGALVVFEEAVDHVLRIDRVMKQPLGHMLLAGASGVGKTLLTRFAAWLRGMPVFSVRVSHKYSLADFDRDLRTVMTRCGADGEKLVFIFDESNVLSSAFLERMNALLASGEVPGLFDGEYRAQLVASCSNAWGSSADTMNEDGIMRKFTRNVQRNLHVVFTINPATAQFSNRRATSPALFNRCVVSWWATWSPTARAQVAAYFVQSLRLDDHRRLVSSAAYSAPSFSASADGRLSDNAIALNTAAAARLDLASVSSATGAAVSHGGSQYTYTDATVASLLMCYDGTAKIADEHNASQALKREAGQQLQQAFVSPRDFMDSLRHFLSVYAEKRAHLEGLQSHVSRGIDRVKITEQQVATMRVSLAAKKRDLAIKNDAANAKLATMVADQQEAQKQQAASLSLKAALVRKTEEVRKREDEVASELREAEPALAEARSSVQGINRQQLDELRSMASPPAPVKLCMEAVITLMGSNESGASGSLEWADIRKVLKGSDFIPTVVNLRTESLSVKARKLVSDRYVNSGGKDFTFERINGASKACGPLYKWVVSQLQYAAILERVEPLRAEAVTLAAEREQVAAEASVVEKALARLEASIAQSKIEYAALIREAEGLRREMEAVQTKVDRASALVASLARERARWEKSKSGFKQTLQSLASDSTVAAAFLAYSGYYDVRTRQLQERQWRQACASLAVPCSLDCSPETEAQANLAIDFLSSAADRVSWQEMGAAADDGAIGNVVLLSRFRRFPLIIDPSGAAIDFVSRMRSGNQPSASVARASLLDHTYLKVLESACRFGTTIVLTDAEAVDPMLNSLLNCEVNRSGMGTDRATAGRSTGVTASSVSANASASSSTSRVIIRLGDAEVDLSPSFAMYLFTRDSSARFTPDIMSRVTLVNYTVTASGLCDTVVNKLLLFEAPQVQATRTKLLHAQAQTDRRLAQLEESLLTELSAGDSSASLLDDDRLIVALEAIKAEAGAIERDREQSAEVLRSVATVSSAFAPIASAVTEAYFALERSGSIASELYQFDLTQLLAGVDTGLRVLALPSDSGAQTSETASSEVSTLVPETDRLLSILQAVLGGIGAVTSRAMYMEHGRAWQLVLLLVLARGACTISGYGAKVGDNQALASPSLEMQMIQESVSAASESDRVGGFIKGFTTASSSVKWVRQAIATMRVATDSSGASWVTPGAAVPVGWQDSGDWPATSAGGTLSAVLQKLRPIAVAAHVRPDAVGPLVADAVNAHLSLPNTACSNEELDVENVATAILPEGSGTVPTLLVCTPGADVEMLIHNAAAVAAARVAATSSAMSPTSISVRSIAMGAADSITAAENALTDAIRSGCWLMLRNVHLAAGWLQTTIKKLQRGAVSTQKPHATFRLIITMEVPQLLGSATAYASPVSSAVLRSCNKLMLETPAGLRAAFVRALHAVDTNEGFQHQSSSKDTSAELQRRMRLALAWSHAVLLERRRYTPAGWSKVYDFAESDLQAAGRTLDEALRKAGKRGASQQDGMLQVLKFVRQYVADVIHGARLETPQDAQLLRHICDQLLGDSALQPSARLTVLAGPTSNCPALLAPTDEIFAAEGAALLAWAQEHVLEQLSPAALGLAGTADVQLRGRSGRAITRIAASLALDDAIALSRGPVTNSSAVAAKGVSAMSVEDCAADLSDSSQRLSALAVDLKQAAAANSASAGVATCVLREIHHIVNQCSAVKSYILAQADDSCTEAALLSRPAPREWAQLSLASGSVAEAAFDILQRAADILAMAISPSETSAGSGAGGNKKATKSFSTAKAKESAEAPARLSSSSLPERLLGGSLEAPLRSMQQPAAFLAAVQQAAALKSGLLADSLHVSLRLAATAETDPSTPAPSSLARVLVRGLVLDGVQVKHTGKDAGAAVSFHLSDEMTVAAVPVAAFLEWSDKPSPLVTDAPLVPLYASLTQRSRALLTVPLPSDGPQTDAAAAARWALRGVALGLRA
jgi:dynein heavy chain 1